MSRPRARLDTLPKEILSNIFSYIDKDDAYAICALSKAFVDPAEDVIWRNIYTEVPAHWMNTIPEETEELKELQVDRWPTPHWYTGFDGYKNCVSMDTVVLKRDLYEDKLYDRVQQVQKAFLSRRSRSNKVRKLEILISEKNIVETSKMIKTISKSGRLKHLSISMFTSVPTPQPPTLSSLKPFLESVHTLTNLTFLEYQVATKGWEDCVESILTNCKNIHTFLIQPSAAALRRTSFHLEMDNSSALRAPFCPQLKFLRVVLFPQLMPYVARLIEQSPKLEQLRISDCGNGPAWDHPGNALELHKGLPKHPNLKFIDIRGGDRFQESIEIVYSRGGFENVEEVVYSPSGLEISQNEFIIDNLRIPPLKSMKRLVFPIVDSHWISPMMDYMVYPKVTPFTFETLLDNPTLESIQAVPITMLPRHDEYPSTWCSKQISTILIRTYLHPSSEYTLSHFRYFYFSGELTLSENIPTETIEQALIGLPEIRECEGKKCQDHLWIDVAGFGGHSIPKRILEQVYALSEESMEWTIPGRDLSLPQKAWDILFNWTRKRQLARQVREDENRTQRVRKIRRLESGFSPQQQYKEMKSNFEYHDEDEEEHDEEEEEEDGHQSGDSNWGSVAVDFRKSDCAKNLLTSANLTLMSALKPLRRD